MTPATAEKLLMNLSKARRVVLVSLGEEPLRWEVDKPTFDEFMFAQAQVEELYGSTHVLGIPVRVVGESQAGWHIVSSSFVMQQERRRRVPQLLDHGPTAPFEVLSQVGSRSAPLSFLGMLEASAKKFGHTVDTLPPPDDADLSQIEADIQALAAKQPATKPAAHQSIEALVKQAFKVPDHLLPPIGLYGDSKPFLSAAAADAVDLEKVQAQIDQAFKSAGKQLVAQAKNDHVHLHTELGLKIPDPPLYPPDPALTKAAGKAVMKAAEQVAAALHAGDLPVPPQAHHATVGDITVHISVEITKENAPWKS